MQVERLTRGAESPTPAELAAFLGPTAFRRWNDVIERIARAHPGVFAPDWINGGAKHGWALRFKKSKSYCTLLPERGGCSIQIVFGAEERREMITTRSRLSAASRKAYDNARLFHDGKWLHLPLGSAAAVDDAFQMLAIKRKPRRPAVVA